ncbi:13035_t:CDS:2 [Ambispora leptoticha]|uniref:13035_t:CDS:1 n=1 Tax=Ambispora leptoticha TaxID=144679 RepID=A0A9N9FXD2_9GLOM|nr:13035_t:CDS:2 [Ambispora leptoticha]
MKNRVFSEFIEKLTRALAALVAADELLLDELVKHIQEFLLENAYELLSKNYVLVLRTIFRLVACTKLQDYCLEYICADPQPFFESIDPRLNKEVLLRLLERDDFIIEEIIIWDSLIKWGRSQRFLINEKNDNNDLNLSEWSLEDFSALGKILEPFIPLVRFFEISSEDFYDKIRPYKKSLPSELYEELMAFYLKGTKPTLNQLPPRISKIDSNIITWRHAVLLANWIDHKEQTSVINWYPPYEFNLLFRGSRDEFTASSFHQKCDEKNSVIVVCRLDSSQIIGGYDPFGYTNQSEGWRASPEYFIFSLGINEESTSAFSILSRFLANDENASYNHPSFGPFFGDGDLTFLNPLTEGTCYWHSYSNPLMVNNHLKSYKFKKSSLHKSVPTNLCLGNRIILEKMTYSENASNARVNDIFTQDKLKDLPSKRRNKLIKFNRKKSGSSPVRFLKSTSILSSNPAQNRTWQKVWFNISHPVS